MNKNKIFKPIICLLVLIFSFALLTEIQAQSKKISSKAKKAAAVGDRYFNQKDYRNAVNKYAEAATISPDYSYAHFWKGYAHYYLEEFDLAIDELDKALAQGHKPLEVYKLRWFLNYNKQNYDAALNDVQKGLELDSSNSNMSLGLGDIYHAKGNYQASVDAYKKAFQLDPNNGDAHYFMALNYSNLGNYEQQGLFALESVRKGTKYVGEAYYLAGDSFQKAGKLNEAVENYKRTINVNPKIKDVYAKLSEIYRSQKRLDDAIETTEKGLKQYPQDGNLYANLSWYYSLANRNVPTIENAKKAVEILPDNYLAHLNLCRAYSETMQYPLALESCNDTLKIAPDDGEANYYLARAYDFTGKQNLSTPFYKKAATGLVKTTEKNPDNANNFYLLGGSYFVLGQVENAIEAYKKSVRLNPKFTKAIYNLGVAYLNTKQVNKDSANEQYKLLLNLDTALAEKLKKTIAEK